MSSNLPVGQKIRFLPLEESDRDWYMALAMDPVMMQFVDDPRTLAEATEDFDSRAKSWSLDNENWYAMAVVDINTQERLGDVAIKIVDKKALKAEVGFMLRAHAQGKGVGSEAMKLLVEHAFAAYGVNKLVAYCDVQNIGSWKVLEKCGFSREGFLKQNAFVQGKYVDDYVYGLCREDHAN